ncbi:Geraniol synthase, chloroplastic [Cinnamomum micranthum f. kanehirae]|uniref:Geraniol synthase, chloroplastic n=1 Tax=Cinnamomum micranthum f. kanehirae TaxID=337451 RepID=A0A3S3P0K0_9MAGN|nr:Geraniol synthase, chloroplastic [Cinnamomum micranthum f. kanehirae]
MRGRYWNGVREKIQPVPLTRGGVFVACLEEWAEGGGFVSVDLSPGGQILAVSGRDVELEAEVEEESRLVGGNQRSETEWMLQDVFNDFKDEKGCFKPSLSMDIKGMLSLYEASHLAFQGEIVLDEARAFASTHLMDIKENIDPILHKKVEHALDMPLHWRWWKDLGLGVQLSFTRDRLVECFFWAAAMTPEPQFGRCQEAVAKVAQLIIIIDDIYDVYGTVNELEHFTNAIDRWDLEAMEQLPEYMKTYFLALYNSINEIGYEILKEEGRNVIPYLRNTEYLQTSWISIGSLPMQTYVFALLGKNLAPESSDFAEKISDILPLGGLMIRLPDDLGTSTVCSH